MRKKFSLFNLYLKFKRQSPEMKRKLFFLYFGYFIFFSIKAIIVYFNDRFSLMPNWFMYLLVHVFLIFPAWIYHSLITFQVPLTYSTLKKQAFQSVGLKVLDYAIFNYLVYPFNMNPTIASVVLTPALTIVRGMTHLKFVYKEQQITHRK